MNWDQIEKNWAAMARRVRPDLPSTVAHEALQKSVGIAGGIVADDGPQTVANTTSATRQML